MSGLGHKRTSSSIAIDVCFTPENGLSEPLVFVRFVPQAAYRVCSVDALHKVASSQLLGSRLRRTEARRALLHCECGAQRSEQQDYFASTSALLRSTTRSRLLSTGQW